jgi:hypothetical protein
VDALRTFPVMASAVPFPQDFGPSLPHPDDVVRRYLSGTVL